MQILFLNKLTRVVKNVIGLKRPAPYEEKLQQTECLINHVEKFGLLSAVDLFCLSGFLTQIEV